MSYSAGLLNVTNLTANGASGALNATNATVTTLNATNVSATNIGLTNNLNLGGQLSIQGNQYTNDTFEKYITLSAIKAYDQSTQLGTSFQVKLKINKVGNQVTVNFPLMNFYIPQQDGNIITKQSAFLQTISDGIPPEFSPKSLAFNAALAPNLTRVPNLINPTQFLGSIIGNVLKVTQVNCNAPLVVGQIITSISPDTSGNNIIIEDSSNGIPGTFITGYGTGKGGIGTYYINNSQTINDFTVMHTQENDYSGAAISMPSYVVQISPKGNILITGSAINTQSYAYAGGYSGIPVGLNTIAPFSMSYIVNDFIDISSMGTNLNNTHVNVLNTIGWPSTSPQFNVVDCSGYMNYDYLESNYTVNYAIRDQALMDSLNSNVYHIWSDNSTQSFNNFTTPVGDVMYRKGTVDNSGNFTLGECFQLTNFANLLNSSGGSYYDSIFSKLPYKDQDVMNGNVAVIALFGTAVCVNKIHPWNVVAATCPMMWAAPFVDRNGLFVRYSHVFVSNDYGTTWPNEFNGPVNANPVTDNGFADNRGVFCDMYGTFWYLKSQSEALRRVDYDPIGAPLTLLSSKDGITWYSAYTAPCNPTAQPSFGYDSPTIEFGYDGTNSDISSNVSGNQTFNCVDSSGGLTVSFTLNVVDASNFPLSGSFNVHDSSNIIRTIWYTGKTATSFTGCIATDTFTSFTLNTGSTIQCLGQYGIWCNDTLLYNGPGDAGTGVNGGLLQYLHTVFFLPINGPWNDQDCTFVGYFGSGSGSGDSSANDILTVSSISSGSLVIGQQICGQNLTLYDSSGVHLPYYNIVDDKTTILSQISGTSGGVGTYYVSVKQDVASQTCYAFVPTLGVSRTISGVSEKIVSSDVSILPTRFYDFIINVNDTSGMPVIGAISVPNDVGGTCTILYNGTTNTSLLNCSTWCNGVGSGFTLSTGTTIKVLNSPSFLNDQQSMGVSQITCTQDGRVFIVDGGANLMYKSIPGSTYPDPVNSNWVGPFAISYRSVPVADTVGDTGSVCYDDKTQTLYHYLFEGFDLPIDPNSDNTPTATLYLVFSRDNGMTWSDPIVLSNELSIWVINSMKLDKATGNLNFSFYKQLTSNPSDVYNGQRYALTIPAAQLNGYISSTPIVNNNYSVPPLVTPPIGGGIGVYGQIIVPQS